MAVARANDVLLKVHSAQNGTFLVANELQLYPTQRMPRRVRAYAALAEERYELPVYPVAVNILRSRIALPDHYHSDFMGIMAHQDFRVPNLWEQDADLVFEQNLVTLLPFVPVLRGGESESMLSKALTQLRANEAIAELEPLLAFFASFVLHTDIVRRIMRWDMTILRESPWYNEILQEGLETGRKQGIEQGIEHERVQLLLHILQRRFGDVSPALEGAIRTVTVDDLTLLLDVALDATALSDVEEANGQLREQNRLRTNLNGAA